MSSKKPPTGLMTITWHWGLSLWSSTGEEPFHPLWLAHKARNVSFWTLHAEVLDDSEAETSTIFDLERDEHVAEGSQTILAHIVHIFVSVSCFCCPGWWRRGRWVSAPGLTALDAPPLTVPATPSSGGTSFSSGTTPRTHVSTTAKRKRTDAALD